MKGSPACAAVDVHRRDVAHLTNGWVCGGADLAETAVYTDGFAKAVLCAHIGALKQQQHQWGKDHTPDPWEYDVAWRVAGLFGESAAVHGDVGLGHLSVAPPWLPLLQKKMEREAKAVCVLR